MTDKSVPLEEPFVPRLPRYGDLFSWGNRIFRVHDQRTHYTNGVPDELEIRFSEVKPRKRKPRSGRRGGR